MRANSASGRGGGVASAHPLATDAGIAALEAGGNAMDAAIATAAVLGVAQPMMSGLGGDCFILHYEAASGRMRSVAGAGPAPRGLELAVARAQPDGMLPQRGVLSAAVPGAPDAMWLAHRRFGSGRLGMPALFARAVELAAGGVAIAPAVARFFKVNEALLAASPTARAALLCRGHAPLAGEMLRQPELAATLQALAEQGPDSFYRGRFAQALAEFSRERGGCFALEDLARYAAEENDPISVRYGSHRVWSNPPVAQGVVLLQALGILAHARGAAGGGAEADALKAHRMIESLKRAFFQRNRLFGDPRFVPDASSDVLADTALAAQAARISDDTAQPSPEQPCWSFGDGDTTALVAADAQGNVVSFITSLSTPFGAAEVVPGTGVLLNNRAGRGFSLDPRSPNVLAGGKRTMSTLHAYIACGEDGAPVLAGCTSGGDGQPQWNLQMIDAVLGEGLDVAQAVAMPRWELTPGTDPSSLQQPYEVLVDPRIDADVLQGLRSRGHAISGKPLGMLGAAQMISIDASRQLRAAADPRADGTALVLD